MLVTLYVINGFNSSNSMVLSGGIPISEALASYRTDEKRKSGFLELGRSKEFRNKRSKNNRIGDLALCTDKNQAS